MWASNTRMVHWMQSTGKSFWKRIENVLSSSTPPSLSWLSLTAIPSLSPRAQPILQIALIAAVKVMPSFPCSLHVEAYSIEM